MAGIEHGGALDRAVARHGGRREDWLDLSTGINPVPYPIPEIPSDVWHRLPDEAVMQDCLAAAREYYGVPKGAAIVAAPGTQAIIQWLPVLFNYLDRVSVVSPTYGEYERVFRDVGADVETPSEVPSEAGLLVVGQPNNPDGRVWERETLLATGARMTVVDEAFADVAPDASLIPSTGEPGVLVLRSFGKFFGLAGLRLGFAIGHPDVIESLARMLGPWSVSGPALHIAAVALRDAGWIAGTREQLASDRARLAAMLQKAGMEIAGGTDLFVLAKHAEAGGLGRKLAERQILVRSFEHEPTWLRFGLPDGDADFERLGSALDGAVR